MKDHLPLILALTLFCACDDKARPGEGSTTTPEGAPAEAEADAAEATPPTPEPYTGPLDAQRLTEAKGLVRPFDLWSEAEPRLLATLGEPSLVEGKTRIWAVRAGDACTLFRVEVDEGQDPPAVGMVRHPENLSPGDEAWAICERATAE